jgi:hypothetical protein
MACFSEPAQKLFKDWKQDKLFAELERDHAQLVERRVASVLCAPALLGAFIYHLPLPHLARSE